MGRKFAEAHASIFLAKLLGDVAPNYMELRSPCGAGVGQMALPHPAMCIPAMKGV